jgi:hypothetical protein
MEYIIFIFSGIPASYAALKIQYNRLYTHDPLPKNGVDSQLAFTF